MNETPEMSKDTLLAEIAAEAHELHDFIVHHRRHLHRHPELSFKEEQTARYLRAQVQEIGLEPRGPVKEGRFGFYADIVSPQDPGKFVLLRADIDALPVQEESAIDFKSTIPGVGHQCGHDSHSAMLLAAAKLLHARREELPVSVRFVFQHAEEVSPGGARDFVEAGLVEDVFACYGLHVSPRIASGTFGLRVGPTMAQAGTFVGTIRGRGGHGAAPHETVDPMPAAAASILNLQQIVSRRIPYGEPCVVSVCQVHGGSATNIIPDEVVISGTYRSFNKARVGEIERMIREIISSTASSYGCAAHVHIDSGYPPLVNDAKAQGASQQAIAAMFGPESVVEMKQTMGGEDFAFFAQERPSSFVFLGSRIEGEDWYPLHHSKFLPDESVLWRGTALLAAMPFVAPDHVS